jgi:hypothetical protein
MSGRPRAPIPRADGRLRGERGEGRQLRRQPPHASATWCAWCDRGGECAVLLKVPAERLRAGETGHPTPPAAVSVVRGSSTISCRAKAPDAEGEPDRCGFRVAAARSAPARLGPAPRANEALADRQLKGWRERFTQLGVLGRQASSRTPTAWRSSTWLESSARARLSGSIGVSFGRSTRRSVSASLR